MKQVIKITDIESGKELEIVKGKCSECFYCKKQGCKYFPLFLCESISEFIFKEVTKKPNELHINLP